MTLRQGLGKTDLGLLNQSGKTYEGKGDFCSPEGPPSGSTCWLPQSPRQGQTWPRPLLPPSLPTQEEMRQVTSSPSPPSWLWETRGGAQILPGQDPGSKGSRAVNVWTHWQWGHRRGSNGDSSGKPPPSQPNQSAERSPMATLSCWCSGLQGI